MSVVVLSCAMEISRQYGAFFESPVLMDDYYQWKFFDQIRCVVQGMAVVCGGVVGMCWCVAAVGGVLVV